MRFIHCYVGEVGSVHDARVLAKSDLTRFFCDDCFPDDSHLIGDEAYNIGKYLLVPFKNNGHLTPEQKNFNFRLSSSRTCIERSFARLTGKERRILDRLPMLRTELIPRFIIALCTIHNLNLEEENLEEIELIANDILEDEGEYRKHEGILKRQQIMQALPIQIDQFVD